MRKIIKAEYLGNKSKDFQRMIRYFSLRNARILSNDESMVCADHPSPNDPVLGSKIAVIHFTGIQFRLILKAHFNPVEWTQLVYDDNPRADLLIIDHFKEFLNIVAGHIKSGLLEQCAIETTVSFPFCLTGLDNLITTRTERKFKDIFVIGTDELYFTCTAELDMETSSMESFKFEIKDDEDIHESVG